MTQDRLNAEIAVELELIEETLAHLEDLLRQVTGEGPSHHQLAAMSAYLVDFYNGVENTLKRILRDRAKGVPDGPDWHVRVLSMFGPDPAPGLPRLLDRELLSGLDTYRALRHLIVHGYSVSLRWDRMRPAAEGAGRVFESLRSRLREFMTTGR